MSTEIRTTFDAVLSALAVPEKEWPTVLAKYHAAPGADALDALLRSVVASVSLSRAIVDRVSAGIVAPSPQRETYRVVDLWSAGEAAIALADALASNSPQLSAIEVRARCGALLTSARLLLLDTARWALDRQNGSSSNVAPGASGGAIHPLTGASAAWLEVLRHQLGSMDPVSFKAVIGSVADVVEAVV